MVNRKSSYSKSNWSSCHHIFILIKFILNDNDNLNHYTLIYANSAVRLYSHVPNVAIQHISYVSYVPFDYGNSNFYLNQIYFGCSLLQYYHYFVLQLQFHFDYYYSFDFSEYFQIFLRSFVFTFERQIYQFDLILKQRTRK